MMSEKTSSSSSEQYINIIVKYENEALKEKYNPIFKSFDEKSNDIFERYNLNRIEIHVKEGKPKIYRLKDYVFKELEEYLDKEFINLSEPIDIEREIVSDVIACYNPNKVRIEYYYNIFQEVLNRIIMDLIKHEIKFDEISLRDNLFETVLYHELSHYISHMKNPTFKKNYYKVWFHIIEESVANLFSYSNASKNYILEISFFDKQPLEYKVFREYIKLGLNDIYNYWYEFSEKKIGKFFVTYTSIEDLWKKLSLVLVKKF